MYYKLLSSGTSVLPSPLDILLDLKSLDDSDTYTAEHLNPEPTHVERLFRYLGLSKSEFTSQDGNVVIQKKVSKGNGGAFGSITIAHGARRDLGSRSLKPTSSTSDIVIKEQSPAEFDVLLVIREFLFGLYIADAYRDHPEDSPCPKTLAMEMTRTPGGGVTTQLLQTKAKGVSLGQLIFGKSVKSMSPGSQFNSDPLFDRFKWRILYGIFSQLRKLHALGIVHNDLNPFNIMIDIEALSNTALTHQDTIPMIQLVDLGRSIFVGSSHGKSDPYVQRATGINFYHSYQQTVNLQQISQHQHDSLCPITHQDEMFSFGLFMHHMLTSQFTRWGTTPPLERSSGEFDADLVSLKITDPESYSILMKLLTPPAGQVSSDDLLAYLHFRASAERAILMQQEPR